MPSYRHLSLSLLGNTDEPWKNLAVAFCLTLAFICSAVIVVWLVVWRQELPQELLAGCQAGWAVANEKPLYLTVQQYHGAPLVAVLLAPIAQPVEGPLSHVPAPVVMLLWCLLGILAWIVAVITLQRLGYYLNNTKLAVAALLLLLPLILSLTQGRADILVVALLLVSLAELRSNRSSGAGLLLAVACTLEILCLVTILLSVNERDRRQLYATMVGLLLTLLLLPALVFGLERTSLLNREFFQICWNQTGLLPVSMAHLLAIWCSRKQHSQSTGTVDSELPFSQAA